MSRFAFARRPKWIFGHLLVLLVVVSFVNLGFWQLRRLHQRRAYNAVVERNERAPIQPIADVLPAGSAPARVDPQLERRVSATGRYLTDDEVLITGQALNGQPGAWIVTPLQLADRSIVLVNRGWIPDSGALSAVPAGAAPPSGEVRVEGLITKTQTAEGLERKAAGGGKLASIARVDVARIGEQLDGSVVPAFITRTTQQPADSGSIVPTTLPLPELSEGPHLNYAMQWFSFTAMTLIGYPLLLRKVSRAEAKLLAGESPSRLPDPADLPEGAFIDEDGVIDMTGVSRHD